MPTDPSLQPLRIPSGWRVSFNDWAEVDPNHPDPTMHLSEDMLLLEHEHCNLIVDVGWYGRAPAGGYAAVVHRGDFHGPELAKFQSRERLAVVATVEHWLANPYAFRDP
jgi:hypothetical protein